MAVQAPDGGGKVTVMGAGNTVKGSYGAPPPPPAPTAQDRMNNLLQQNQVLAQAYSPGSPGYSQSSGGGSRLVQAGPDLNSIISMLGLGQIKPPSLADLQKQAASQTDLTLNPQISSVQNLINQLNSSSADQLSALNALGARQKSDVQSTFDRLKAFMDASTNAGLGRYDTAAQGVDQGHQQILDALARNYANAQQATNAEQARLGLNGAGSTLDNSKLSSDQAFLQGLADANRANAANNLGLAKANYGGVQGMLESGQQQAGASALAQIAQSILDKQATINQAQSSGLQNYNQQLATLQASREAQNQANLAALQQAANDQVAKQQAMILQAISAANAGLKSVSNPSSSVHVGATPASGLTPQQALANELSILKYGDSAGQSALTNQLNQQKFSLQLLNTAQTLGINPTQLLQQLGATSGSTTP